MLILLAGPRFEGCGSDTNGDTALPREDVEVCFSDSDCDTGECADIRCLAGACTRISDTLDRDGDGEAPTRCGGTDCNDRDPRIFAAARETCDAIDQDCDSRIDEDAPDEVLQVTPAVFDRESVIIRWGDGFALTQIQPGVIFLWPVAVDGTLDDPIELLRLSMGSSFRAVRASTRGNETLLVALTDIGATLYALTQDTAVVDSGDIPWEGQVFDVAVVAHQDDYAIGVQVFLDDGSQERFVRTRRDAEPVLVGEEIETVSVPMDIASSGVDVAVRIDGGFEFVGSGDQVFRSEGIRRPMASAEDSIVFAYNDGFGIALQYFDTTGSVSSPQPGPLGRPLDTDIVAVDNLIGIFARTTAGRGIWLLDDTLTVYVQPFIDLGTDTGELSVATQPNATAFYGAGTDDPRLLINRQCSD